MASGDGEHGDEEGGIVVCVTGGSGGIGSAICRLLSEQRHTDARVREVRVLDLSPPPDNSNFSGFKSKEATVTSGTAEATGAAPPRLVFVQGSILDAATLERAFEGASAVFHVASLISYAGQHTPRALMAVNVEGTRCVLRACRACSVPTLVYTSSLDAIQPLGDSVGLKSDAPYPLVREEFSSGAYGMSKSLAESHVLACNAALCADGSTLLRTAAMRFRAVYGEHDQVMVPAIVTAAAQGMLTFTMGPGDAKQDQIYAGNAAYGHLCALNALGCSDAARRGRVEGRAFNLSHEEPMSIYQLAAPFAEAFKLRMPTREVPVVVMYYAAWLLELLFALAPGASPPLSRAMVDAVTNERTFGDPAALRDLGFEPLFSKEEAVCRTLEWLRTDWDARPGGPDEQKRLKEARFSWRTKFCFAAILAAILARFLVYRAHGT